MRQKSKLNKILQGAFCVPLQVPEGDLTTLRDILRQIFEKHTHLIDKITESCKFSFQNMKWELAFFTCQRAGNVA